MCMSVPQIDAIFIFTRTSSGLICGMSTFLISMLPNAGFVFTAARILPFMNCAPREWRLVIGPAYLGLCPYMVNCMADPRGGAMVDRWSCAKSAGLPDPRDETVEILVERADRVRPACAHDPAGATERIQGGVEGLLAQGLHDRPCGVRVRRQD